MTLIDLLAMILVFFVFQIPGAYLVTIRDREITRLQEKNEQLQKALLRVERPEIARVAERVAPQEMTEDQIASLKELRKAHASLWAR